MKRIIGVLPIILGLVAGAGCPAPGPVPPPDDTCGAPVAGSADALEVAAADGAERDPTTDPFVPLADGDGVHLFRGGQGADMVGWKLRLGGGGVPECLEEWLRVSPGGDPSAGDGSRDLASSRAPLRTYPRPDGSRTTLPLWVPGYYTPEFTVTVTAAGQTRTLRLHSN